MDEVENNDFNAVETCLIFEGMDFFFELLLLLLSIVSTLDIANLKKITGEDFIDLCAYKQSPKGIKNEVFVDFLAENTKINCKKK